MLTQSQENFFQIVGIESISDNEEVINCIDLTIEEDESFVLANGIISHNSAMGSILQKRNSEKDGIYALKGKIKNCKDLGDLSKNREILEVMQILGIDPTIKGTQMISSYKRIVIACDADCLEGDALIQTPDGSKKISDMIPGDFVISHTGEEREVLNCLEKEDDEYMEISINGKPFKCTIGHKIPISRNGEIIIMEAGDIMPTDLFLSLKNKPSIGFDLDNYELVPSNSIEKKYGLMKFYDITVDQDHSFIVDHGGVGIVFGNCDGFHITSLLINLFHKWFPWIIYNGQLNLLKTPLVSVGDKAKRKYFSDLDEFKRAKPSGNVRYLKGLGSLDEADWEFVMNNKDIATITHNEHAKDYLEMAFGSDSSARKSWLKGKAI